MARLLVLAIARGFIGGMIRMPGDKFEVEDHAFSANWMEALSRPVGGKSAPVAPVAPRDPAPPALVAIPPDWRTIHYTKRIALAKAISGQDVTADVAVGIIEAEADNRDALARVGKVPAAPVRVEKTEAEIVAEAEAVAAAAERADAAADAAIKAAEGADDEDEEAI